MNNIAVYLAFKIPGMYLAGDHKIDLVRNYIKDFKIDGMFSTTFCKQNQVIKSMFVREIKVFMLLQIGTEAADEQIVLLKVRKLADIIYGECALHDNKSRGYVLLSMAIISAIMVLFTDKTTRK